jgi:hypothetical protein
LEKFQNKEGLYNVILLIPIYLLTPFVRINLSYLLRININELSDYNLTAFKLWSFFIAVIVISSYKYLIKDILRKLSNDNKNLVLNELKPFQNRQKKSKPWLVGLLVGLGSLLIFSLIFSIRHRDWRICIYPSWIFISIYFLIIPPNPEINFYIRFFLQIFAGLTSYLIVKQNKLSITLTN